MAYCGFRNSQYINGYVLYFVQYMNVLDWFRGTPSVIIESDMYILYTRVSSVESIETISYDAPIS